MQGRIITLTTDWASNNFQLAAFGRNHLPEVHPIGDHYVAQLKGILMQVSLNNVIVDITHHIQNFNAIQTAYIIKSVYSYYPKGTIHLIGVNSEPTDKKKLGVFKYNDHYFAGINDGMFGMIFTSEPEWGFEIPENDDITGFKAISAFAQVVSAITYDWDISNWTRMEVQPDRTLSPSWEESILTGSVIFVDSFGNLITNISQKLFKDIGRGRPFRILIQGRGKSINALSKDYEADDIVAFFNSNEFLEIAKRNGNMALLENVTIHSAIRVEFDNTILF